jgi:putative holliday junction resolvase
VAFVMNNTAKMLSLDVGDVRIGLAKSDELNMFAHPLCSIERKGGAEISAIADIIQHERTHSVVVGLPLELNGNAGPQAEKVRKFIRQLQGELGRRGVHRDVKIIEWDERLTSRQAERVVAGSGLKNNKRREALDRISATLILESYLAASR